VLALALVAAPACVHAPPDLSPLPAPPATCPVDGCRPADRAQAVLSAGAAPGDACSGASGAACGGAPAEQCTARALAAWSESQDDRGLRCVARMFSDACAQGDAAACAFGGRLWLDGRGVQPDADRAMAMLARACDDGVLMACAVAIRWLGDPAHKSAVDDDGDMRSRLESESGCWLGQPDPCFQVGRLFKAGADGVPPDAARALRAFARGCDLGERISCNELGDALEYGDGAPRDLERAAALFDRACRLGAPIGCANLGYLAEHGEGMARDDGRARVLYREACAAGESYGCRHVELMAAAGPGVPREGEAALAYWQRGCEGRHDARACAFVSLLYLDGPDGLARDVGKSARTLGVACRLGYRPACEWMREVPDE
jgi:TPR repeat protein